MIHRTDLRKLAKMRLGDAQKLFEAKRYDGAVYLAGYAIELALKARICQTLKWPGFPESRREFENYASFKVHNLDVLLSLSGREKKIKTSYLGEWSIVASWVPDVRYRVSGTATRTDVEGMLLAVKKLLKAL